MGNAHACATRAMPVDAVPPHLAQYKYPVLGNSHTACEGCTNLWPMAMRSPHATAYAALRQRWWGA
eukprot:523311-Lingulodinium_polyedra.AAC.1